MDDNLFSPILRGIGAAWWIVVGPIVAVGIGVILGWFVAVGIILDWRVLWAMLLSLIGYGCLVLVGSTLLAASHHGCLAIIAGLLLLPTLFRWYLAPSKVGAFCAIVFLAMVQVAMGAVFRFDWAVWARMAVAGLVVGVAYVGVRLYPIWRDRKDQEASSREKALRRAEAGDAQTR